MADRGSEAIAAKQAADPARSRKRSHGIASVLRHQIVRGEIAPGEPLPAEPVLMRTFGVSRETVREALTVLESETLVQVKRGRGGGPVARRPDSEVVARTVALLLAVREVDPAEVREAKALLERPAAELIARHLPPDAPAELARLLDEARRARPDALAHARAVAAFDDAVVRHAGNHTLAVLAGALREAFVADVLRGTARARGGARARAALTAGRRRFLDAVERRDPGAAAAAWSAQLADAGPAPGAPPRALGTAVAAWWRAVDAAARQGNGAHRIGASIATELRARVAEGSLADGDHLPAVPALAAAFGVSRPTMREALRILESEGLVVLQAGTRSGPVAHHPGIERATALVGVSLESTGATMGDVWEARLLVEPAIMRLAAERSDDLTRRTLWDIRAAAVADFDHTTAFVGHSYRLRFTALHAARNPALGVLFEIIRWIAASSIDAISATTQASPWEARARRRVVETYDELLAAFDRGDGPAAAELWHHHLATTVPLYLSSLGDRYVAEVLD